MTVNKSKRHFYLFRLIDLIRVFMIFLCFMWLGVFIANAADRYVQPPETCTNTDLQSPYTNWDMAATNIQWAVDVATNTETVWVTNGNYSLTNEIMINITNITLKSVNGRDVTFLNGNYAAGNAITNRCIVISNNDVTIDGFTITNGHASPLGKYPNYGGAILALNRANIFNCTISSNYAEYEGGGLAWVNGYISNCIVENNYAGYRDGGGISTLNAGGAPVIVNCIIRRNTGGGIVQITGSGIAIRNCLIAHNSASSANAGYSGVGVRCGNNTTIENCTIVSNWLGYQNPGQRGGGIGIRSSATNVQIRNCIIYSNSAYESGTENWCTNGSSDINFYNCCTTPTNDLPGSGNITNWPMFVDYSATNLRLSANSPCVNTGTNQDWMTNAIDMDGRRRVRYGTVDMGAYENIHEGMVYGIW